MMDYPKNLIRTIPDFPKPGIKFRDVMPLLADPIALHKSVERMSEGYNVSKVVGLEARGFILGAAIARHLGAGFVPIRKPGKLPGPVHSCSYSLEYGSDCLEIQVDAIQQGDRVLLVDDLLATGGTAAAAIRLLTAANANIVGCSFLIELLGLRGRGNLQDWGHDPRALFTFGDGE